MPTTSFDTVVDVVDKRNRRIGSVPRHELLPNRLNFRTVHIFVIDRSGKLILQKLRQDHSRNPTRLGSSVAGYLHAGERYASAATRKLRDELGLKLPLTKVGTFEMIDERSHKFVRLFLAQVVNEAVEFDTTQIDSVVSMPFKQIDLNIECCPEKYTPTFLRAYEFFKSKGYPVAHILEVT